MEIGLDQDFQFLSTTHLPDIYEWTEWTPDLIATHANTKYNCFREELDSQVFPCLGERTGCLRLMKEISTRSTFLPQATWLVQKRISPTQLVGCGTIQGVNYSSAMGAIQNVGITPTERGQGLGKALVFKSLEGFKSSGVARVFLEVTAENNHAVRLYQSIGFEVVRTMYKAIDSKNNKKLTTVLKSTP